MQGGHYLRYSTGFINYILIEEQEVPHQKKARDMILNWEIIAPVLTVLVGGSGISVFFFYRERKKTKRLENDALKLQNEITAAGQWQELFERSDEMLRKKDEKIEELYSLNSKLRDENNTLSTENAVVKLLKCEFIACDKRIPPLAEVKAVKKSKQI